MNMRDLSTLWAFNRWANDRLLTAAGSASSDEFVRDLGASHGSLQGTLVHILWAEWLWVRRWGGVSPKQPAQPERFPDVAAIRTEWADIERRQQAFIEKLSEERLLERVAYENLAGKRWEYPLVHLLQHVVNHSSYHRGQVVTLLRQLGHMAPATDFLVFLDETRAV